MKISNPPDYLAKSRQSLEKLGTDICGPVTESSAYEIGSDITRFFSSFQGNAQIDVGDFDRFVAALGFVFAKCSEIISDWKLEWLCLTEEDKTDGVYALVNKDHSLLVYPIGLIRSDFLKNAHKSEIFFTDLASGKVPSVECGRGFEEYIF